MLSCAGIPLQESYFWPMCSAVDPRKTKWKNCYWPPRSGICSSFFLSLSFSLSHSLALKSSTFLSENMIIWVKTLLYFTQMIIFSPNTSFWTKKGVIWWLFHDNLRAREQEDKVTTNSAPDSPDYQLGWAIFAELGS